MKHLIYYDRQGKITRLTGLPDGMQPEPQAGERYLLSDEYRDTEGQYVDGGRLRPLPPQPSPAHVLDWPTKTWKLNPALAARQARERRDRLLAASDWTQLPDVATATQAKWAPYRQSLRDLSQQPGFPANIVWPTPPA
jgi:hypothetical protein